ncbi:leucine-rich repeat domain-containing protein [Algibacter mikhailovii]|uniref:leucine-rich repeat domain-containing protein n=1 Tax=Algibacter mikhailovii TaxID=425498 RepID=UPI00249446D1|nr:leucine-rich repeat domain-containing protein [Algibacter mikhailovii]
MIKKLLFIALISSGLVQSQTFNVDGINYEVISGTEVKVLASNVTGALVIPEKVNNSSIDYTVTIIENAAFNGQFGLESVEIPNTVTSIGANAFDGCFSMNSLKIGNSVASIGTFAFQSCTSLTTIDLPGSLQIIANNAFQYCTSLLSVIIPNSVETIGDSAFYGCDDLASISIGNSVTAIGENAFGYQLSNSTLTSVNCSIPSPLIINPNVFSNRVLGSCSLNVSVGSLSAYENADVWKDFNPINGTLSNENIDIIDELKIYPNPTQNVLFIEVRNVNNAKIEVYDMLGKAQLNQLLYDGVNTLNTEELSRGIYLFRLISDEGTISRKIVKN